MLVCEVPQIIFCELGGNADFIRPFSDFWKGLFCCCVYKKSCEFCYRKIRRTVCVDEKKKEETVMKALQKASKFLSDYTSLVVIAIAVVTSLYRQ